MRTTVTIADNRRPELSSKVVGMPQRERERPDFDPEQRDANLA